MGPARRVTMEGQAMRATRASRTATRRSRVHKSKTAAHARKPIKPAARPVGVPPEQVLYRFCKPGWAVVVERVATALGTRFVCPFCPASHRVPGPVRGFRKMRRAQWIKLRRVVE
jgi:hypothetical protein